MSARTTHARKRRQGAARGAVHRRGAALVEFAVALPMLLLLLLGTLDACHLLFLKDSLRTAAHEAVRRAAEDDLNSESTIAVAERYLSDLNVQGAVVETTPSETADANSGEMIQVTIRTPASLQAMFVKTVLEQIEITGAAAIVK